MLSAFAEEAAAPRSSAPTHRQQQQRHQQRRADPPASPPGSPPDRAGTTAAEEEDGLWGSLYQGFVPGSASESDSHDDFEADDAAARWQTRKPAGEPVPSAQASTRTRARARPRPTPSPSASPSLSPPKARSDMKTKLDEILQEVGRHRRRPDDPASPLAANYSSRICVVELGVLIIVCLFRVYILETQP